MGLDMKTKKKSTAETVLYECTGNYKEAQKEAENKVKDLLKGFGF